MELTQTTIIQWASIWLKSATGALLAAPSVQIDVDGPMWELTLEPQRGHVFCSDEVTSWHVSLDNVYQRQGEYGGSIPIRVVLHALEMLEMLDITAKTKRREDIAIAASPALAWREVADKPGNWYCTIGGIVTVHASDDDLRVVVDHGSQQGGPAPVTIWSRALTPRGRAASIYAQATGWVAAAPHHTVMKEVQAAFAWTRGGE